MLCALALVLVPGPRAADSAASVRPVLLWEVRPQIDAPGRVFVLGATHVGSSPIESFDPVIEAAFARSQALAIEADARQTESSDFRSFLEEAGHLAPGKTLESVLRPEVYGRLRRLLDARRLRIEPLLGMKPWLVALMLSGDALSRSGYQPDHGMSRYFLERAGGRDLIELEGAKPQILKLDALSPDLQQLMLEDALEEVPRISTRVEEIQELWERGDAAGLAVLLFDQARADRERTALRESMYFERNRSMAQRLELPLERGEVWFVVVGAGHVVGEQGIPRLMQSRGYRVRQLEALSTQEPVRRRLPRN